MQRAAVNVPPFGEFSQTAMVLGEESDGWRLEDDEGRNRFAPRQGSLVADVAVGDRVEIKPLINSSSATRLTSKRWFIVRKVE
jgi:hypothetical protein